jgi:sn-glycerol 3-phosphate transport system substrate-binding protein
MTKGGRRHSDRKGWSRGAAALVVAITGTTCTDDDEPAPIGAGDGPDPGTTLADCVRGPDPPPDEPVTITVWHPENFLRGELLVELVDEFERDHPTIDVELQQVAGGLAMLSRWRLTPPAERPAIALFPQQFTSRLADSGQVVAPGRCLRAVLPDMLPAIEASWSVDGVAQAVPFSVSTPVLYYNRLLFTAAGLDPDSPPRSLEELHDASAALMSSGAADFPMVLGAGSTGPPSWMVEQWNAQAGELTLIPDNGRDVRASRAAFRGGQALASFRWLEQMLDEGLVKVVRDDEDGFNDLLAAQSATEPVGMVLHTCGSLGEVLEVMSGGDYSHIDLDVAPLPGPGAGSLPGGGALWLAAGQPEVETMAAWQLEAWLGSPAVQARWAAATGYVPTSATAAGLEPLPTRWSEHPELRVSYDVISAMGTSAVELGMLAGPEPEIGAAFDQAFRQVQDGTDADAALDAAADAVDALLDAYVVPPVVSDPSP